tara:strand:+ start:961 stop:1152 length:192 start_codon:yes stop_codon:yes gene_type:complete
MANKNIWRYIFYYEKWGSGDKHYFDIFTDKGKSVAEELAFKEVSNIKDWFVLTLVSKKLHEKG